MKTKLDGMKELNRDDFIAEINMIVENLIRKPLDETDLFSLRVYLNQDISVKKEVITKKNNVCPHCHNKREFIGTRTFEKYGQYGYATEEVDCEFCGQPYLQCYKLEYVYTKSEQEVEGEK